MSEWDDRFQNHPLHATVENLEKAADASNAQADGASEVEAVARLQKAVTALSDTLSNVDPELVPQAPLDALNKHATNCLNETNAYSTSGNVPNLANANTHADHILSTLSQLGTYVPSSDNVPGTLANYRSVIGKHLRAVEASAASLEQKMSELEARSEETIADLANQGSRIDAALNQVQEQSAAAEQSRQQAASDAETRREERSSERVRARDDAASEMIDQEKDRLRAFKAEADTAADNVIGELQAQLERAEKLVHVIGNTGMVGGYQKIANDAQKSAKLWRGVTVASMIGIIGFAVFAFLAVTGEAVEVTRFMGRAFAALCFGILAAYAARQAEKFDERERINRTTELELASIAPYLVGLPEEKQHAVKVTLAGRLFGNREEVGRRRKLEETTGTIRDLKELLPDLRKIANKMKPD